MNGKLIVATIIFCVFAAIGGVYYFYSTDIVKDDNNDNEPIQPKWELGIYEIDGRNMVSIEEFGQKLGLTYEYDTFEGVISLYDENYTYYLLKETPVIAVNGIYKPINATPYIQDDQVYLNLDILEEVFNLKYESIEGIQSIAVFADSSTPNEGNKNYLNFQNQFPDMTEEEMIAYLSFLSTPLEGAHLTTQDSQLPGAPRAYRNGSHEGIDWYTGTCGINVNKNTPVLSMADGIVVRADHDYIELDDEKREEILSISANLEHTPQYILDKLRGRTVWVQYDNGVMVRYAHLSRIENNIKVGDSVLRGQIIGYVGNSGTSYGVEGNDVGVHLHSDILIYNNLFWEYLNKQEIRYILETLFPK